MWTLSYIVRNTQHHWKRASHQQNNATLSIELLYLEDSFHRFICWSVIFSNVIQSHKPPTVEYLWPEMCKPTWKKYNYWNILKCTVKFQCQNNIRSRSWMFSTFLYLSVKQSFFYFKRNCKIKYLDKDLKEDYQFQQIYRSNKKGT